MAHTTEQARRRALLQAGLATALGALPLLAHSSAGGAARIEIWKTPTCGCCHDWVAHLQANGFEIQTHDVSDARKRDIRQGLGLADRFGSCHTALVGGYLLEGHVPAREIRRLLREKPRALGLAVPGMPVGSPGMDGPAYGGRKDPYDVLLVQRSGTATVFQTYR
jgi:hypothetical protein